MNKTKANSFYLLTSYKWQETRGPSGKGLYYTPWPYSLLFWVTVRQEQCSYTTKINYVSGTPQAFFELSQLTYMAKSDHLGRWGHRGAGLVFWLFSKLNWIRKTSSKCWRWYKRQQEYGQPFCMAANLFISLRCNMQLHQQSRDEKEAVDCLSPLFKHTGKSHNSSSCGEKKECCFTSLVHLVTTKRVWFIPDHMTEY